MVRAYALNAGEKRAAEADDNPSKRVRVGDVPAGYKIKKIAADNTCFFRAIAEGLRAIPTMENTYTDGHVLRQAYVKTVVGMKQENPRTPFKTN